MDESFFVGDLVEWKTDQYLHTGWNLKETAVIDYTFGNEQIRVIFFDSTQGTATRYTFAKRKKGTFKTECFKKVK